MKNRARIDSESIWVPTCPHFSLKISPKSVQKSIPRCIIFLSIFGWIVYRFWARFGTLGVHFGSLWALKMAEACLGAGHGVPKSRSPLLILRPERRASAIQEPSLADQAFLRAPRDLQEASKRPPGLIWQPCWLHFGAILEQFRSDVATNSISPLGPTLQGPAECA